MDSYTRMLIPDCIHTLVFGRAGKRLHAEVLPALPLAVRPAVDLAVAAIHEAGHVVLTEHVGGRVLNATHIWSDESGLCGQPWFPDDTPLDCVIATYLAGGMAQGVSEHHRDSSWDRDIIREILAEEELTLDEARAVMAHAREIAAYGLKVHAKRLHKIAARLERTGHA